MESLKKMEPNYVAVTHEPPLQNSKLDGYMIRSKYPIKYAEGLRTEQWVRNYPNLLDTFKEVSAQIRNAEIVFSKDIRNSQRKELTDILNEG